MSKYLSSKPSPQKDFIGTFDNLFHKEMLNAEQRRNEENKIKNHYKTFIEERMENIEQRLVQEREK